MGDSIDGRLPWPGGSLPRKPPKPTPEVAFTFEQRFADVRQEAIMGKSQSGPPSKTRFQPGTSGNPNGRPRRTPDDGLSVRSSASAQATLEDGRRLVTMRDQGKARQVSLIEAVAAAQSKSALGGSVVAQRDKLDCFARIERVERLEIEAEHARIQDYKDRIHRVREEAKSQRETFTEPLPHPDDIILIPGQWARFVGPMTPEEALAFEAKRKLRDTLLLQDELDEREFDIRENQSPDDRPGAALVLALQINSALPPRMRASNDDLIFHSVKLAGFTKRRLLKTLYRDWRSLGFDIPRGAVFRPRRFAINILKLLRELDANARANNIDLDGLEHGEFDASARAIFEKYGYEVP